MKWRERRHGFYATQSGYTLPELVMVIVLLGILAAVITPRLFSIQETQARKDAKLLLNYLVFAQELAMTRSTPYGLCLDVAADRYTVNATDCTSAANIIPSPEDRVSPLSVTTGADLTVNPAGTTSIFFDYLGRPTPNGVTLTLTAGSYTATIRVEPNTGYIHEL